MNQLEQYREQCAAVCDEAKKNISPDYIIGDDVRNAGIACCENIAKRIRALPLPEVGKQFELEVWYGPMPESNGKHNYTAWLKRKGGSWLDGDEYTFQRSEYPDRVRYEADFMRYLIGEIAERPDILDYDADKHSGYVDLHYIDLRKENDQLRETLKETLDLLEYNADYFPESGAEDRSTIEKIKAVLGETRVKMPGMNDGGAA